MYAWAVPDCVLIVCELHLSVTVDFDVGLFPKLIFGKFVCFDLVINYLASVTCAVEFDCVADLAFFICLSLVGGRLCHLGSERLSSLSDVLFQSTETVRPHGFVIFNSDGMNPPAKYLVSFRLFVLN